MKKLIKHIIYLFASLLILNSCKDENKESETVDIKSLIDFNKEELKYISELNKRSMSYNDMLLAVVRFKDSLYDAAVTMEGKINIMNHMINEEEFSLELENSINNLLEKYGLETIKYNNTFKNDMRIIYNKHYLKLLYLKSSILYLEIHNKLLRKYSKEMLNIISDNMERAKADSLSIKQLVN